jgi:hypothetical protein
MTLVSSNSSGDLKSLNQAKITNLHVTILSPLWLKDNAHTVDECPLELTKM